MSVQPAGEIRVGPRAIVAIVTGALQTVEGFISLAPGARALVVQPTAAGLDVEIEVLLAYGTPIEKTAGMLSLRVRSALEQSVGQPIAAVRVYVQGTRHQ